ncbi:MAG: o-succinylbenzoate synthase [Bacteroidota bacterium]
MVRPLDELMEISVEKLDLQFKKPSGTSRGVLYSKPSWIVRLVDSTGKSGVGEFSVIPGLSIDFIDEASYEFQIQKMLDFLRVILIHPIQYQDIIEKVNAEFRNFPSLVFGVETAILDYMNGGTGLIFKNTFAIGESEIPINGLIWMGTKAEMKSQIQEKLKLGYKTIKLKIGAIAIEDELELITELRREFNSDLITIRVDANGAFDESNVREVLKKLQLLEVHSIEQPIQAGNWELMSELCKENTIPIALDEELIGIFEKERKIDLLDLIKPQFIILKPSLHGGIIGCSEWIELAEERNIGWWMTSALESSIGLNAIAQFTANYSIEIPQGLGTGGLYTNNLPSDLVIESGYLKRSIDDTES